MFQVSIYAVFLALVGVVTASVALVRYVIGKVLNQVAAREIASRTDYEKREVLAREDRRAIVEQLVRSGAILENHLGEIGRFMAAQTELMRTVGSDLIELRRTLDTHNREERNLWADLMARVGRS